MMKKFELNFEDETNLKKTIENDVLGRNQKLINMIKLMSNIDEHFTIALDGDWGSGKTFFLKQMIYLMNNYKEFSQLFEKNYGEIEDFSKKNTVIYYNAWENDDHENPVESLIYNFLNEYPKKKKHIADESNLFDSIKPLMINVIEKFSLGIITKDCFESLKSFSDLADKIITIEEKKNALNKLFEQLLGDQERILLVIDELDRCKPDYAVKMLETIKHFYNNSRITVIVSTNNKQLSNTINHFYGNNFDGYGYLNKIYDTVISLRMENVEKYVKHYLNIIRTTHLPEDVSYLMFEFFGFSYRECNKYMSMYNIVEPYTKMQNIHSSKEFTIDQCVFLPFALALKIKDIDLYEKFIKGSGVSIINEFVEFLGNFEKNKEYTVWFNEIFEVKENESLMSNFQEKYKQVMSKKKSYYSFPYTEAISMLGNSIKF